MMKPDHQDPNDLDNMKPWKKYYLYKFTMNVCYGKVTADMLRIRLREAGSDEEIFTFVEWIRAFNINEPIYTELFHEFYSTYESNEVCADDELQTKKIIKFRLGRPAHNLTLLEFAHRLGLYQVTELDEEGFNVYFEGGLHSDDHFNAQEYWLSISREENLSLSMSHASTIKYPVLRVIHKMITYGLCQRTTRVGIPRPPRASMQDLYDRMGRIEIRQEGIERVEYRQSYHWDRCHGLFENLDEVYSVSLQGAYNPLVMLSPSMINIISSIQHHHHTTNSSTSRMMMSSVETTRVD
uniref:Uncharacterized protein n=1 Tax=Tanacetum cinerariifolium TaxID=118510 RepID=A0A6L2MNW7_TANCI|nr:hypothetical protein [Tanacetum cinerariifolium]